MNEFYTTLGNFADSHPWLTAGLFLVAWRLAATAFSLRIYYVMPQLPKETKK